MYKLSDTQIDYILNDIRARGVELEDLQYNLLDHVCCIVERELEPGDDFETFYQRTIKTFYKNELREIEEEASLLLTYKNYYAMKKIMIGSGALAALLLSTGIAFKFQHWPGAGMLIVLGITIFSLLFLPLVFILKVKENSDYKDKVIVALGTVSGILLSMSVMFKIMHWPGANAMGLIMLFIVGAIFLPLYFFSGIKRAGAKINTIVFSVFLVIGCGLFLSLVRSPSGTRQQNIADTNTYLRNERILQTELRQAAQLPQAGNSPLAVPATKITAMCNDLKTYIIQGETGQPAIDAGFETRNAFISDALAENYFHAGSAGYKKLRALTEAVNKYNNSIETLAKPTLQTITVKSTILDGNNNSRVIGALTDLIQIQMVVAQNERELAGISHN